MFVPSQNFSFRTSTHSQTISVAIPAEVRNIVITSDEHAVRKRIRQFRPDDFDIHLMVGDMSESGVLQEFDDEFQDGFGHHKPRLFAHGNHDELFEDRRLN